MDRCGYHRGWVAHIERVWGGCTYFVFPGGGVEADESPEDPAAREACEEPGVKVDLGDLVFETHHGGRAQRYYSARLAGGTFGTGKGMEIVPRRRPRRVRTGRSG